MYSAFRFRRAKGERKRGNSDGNRQPPLYFVRTRRECISNLSRGTRLVRRVSTRTRFPSFYLPRIYTLTVLCNSHCRDFSTLHRRIGGKNISTNVTKFCKSIYFNSYFRQSVFVSRQNFIYSLICGIRKTIFNICNLRYCTVK